MCLIAVVSIEHEQLALVPTIRQGPPVDVRVVANSMTDPETEMFFFHVRTETGDFDQFESALERDETIAEWLVVTESDDSRLYRFKHLSDTELLSPKITELGGLVLEAKAGDAGWRLRIQLPDRQAVAKLWEYCREEGIAFNLERIFEQQEIADNSRTSISDEQRAALVEAYRNGYFDEPRETTQAELAERLGICPTAVGGRIRRGTRRLIEDTVLDD